MATYEYRIYDVFTDERLTGNPLAVVLDADDLDRETMQRLAGEFNLSETVFLFQASSPHHTARAAIFTPRLELPFAGHPTVGAAIALAQEKGLLSERGEAALLMLEEQIGPIRCAVSREEEGGAPFATFDLPRLAEPLSMSMQAEIVAAALGLGPHEIGFENHVVSAWSAGVPYVLIPVNGLAAAAKAKLHTDLWLESAPKTGDLAASPYVYCRETVSQDCGFHARMFAAHEGIGEDPATGSAAAAFSGAVMRFDAPVDGANAVWIEQGVEMGRPSRIRLEMDVEGGKAVRARIGGHAVRLAKGVLSL